MKAQPNGKILVGGYFTSIGNVPRSRIARLNNNGSVDNAFDIPNGANNIVYDFSLQTDGKILVAGAFTKVGNQPRVGAARLIDNSTALRNTPFDFDGDGKADISVFRPSDRVWYFITPKPDFPHRNWAWTDKIAPADYDGDGKTDMAVYRDGVWYILQSKPIKFELSNRLGG